MAGSEGQAETEIARLRSQVATLEGLLRQRSHELRLIQEHACPRDLRLIARVAAGLPPVPDGPFEPEFWEETTELAEADVAVALEALWRSVAPAGGTDEG